MTAEQIVGIHDHETACALRQLIEHLLVGDDIWNGRNEPLGLIVVSWSRIGKESSAGTAAARAAVPVPRSVRYRFAVPVPPPSATSALPRTASASGSTAAPRDRPPPPPPCCT